MTTPRLTADPVFVRRRGMSARRSGYAASVVINIALLYIANNLLGWDLLAFLTEDFARLLWLINLSLGATILANLFWIVFDPTWFRSLAQIGLNLIALLVSIRMYQVFPFDFSGFEFDWTPIVRIVVVITMIGCALGAIVELVKLVQAGLWVATGSRKQSAD